MTTTGSHIEETGAEGVVLPPPAVAAPRPAELAESLVEQARAEGVELVGPDGLLGDLSEKILEASLEVELDENLGYSKHDPMGRDGGNSRNGTRTKTVITEVGPIDIDVSRGRDGSFEPKIVRKRQRRLGGVDQMVMSLTAKGLTMGEAQTHLSEAYGMTSAVRRSRRSPTPCSARWPSGGTGHLTACTR